MLWNESACNHSTRQHHYGMPHHHSDVRTSHSMSPHLSSVPGCPGMATADVRRRQARHRMRGNRSSYLIFEALSGHSQLQPPVVQFLAAANARSVPHIACRRRSTTGTMPPQNLSRHSSSCSLCVAREVGCYLRFGQVSYLFVQQRCPCDRVPFCHVLPCVPCLLRHLVAARQRRR